MSAARIPAIGLALVSLAAFAAKPDDYAQGIELTPAPGYPLQELALPDEVYGGVLHADLSDLRVFSSAGVAVPHALCPPAAPTIPPVTEQALDLYVLQAGAIAGESPTMVRVETAAGSQVTVAEGTTTEPAPPAPQAYVIDARGVAPLLALRLAWRSTDGAAEVRVRVESSEDLDQWRPVVAGTHLVNAAAVGGEAGRSLERSRIGLPPGAYGYLRIERADGGVPLQIDSALGETRAGTVEDAPVRFSALALAPADGAPAFDAQRQAPVQMAAVMLPSPNMSLQLTLSSRAAPVTEKDRSWQQRWHGVVKSVPGSGQAEWPIRFEATPDRWWRMDIQSGADTLGGAPLALELGYRPARLRFLPQGDGPHTLAFGSARAGEPVPGCADLLGDGAAGAGLTGAPVERSAVRELGGKLALTPAPKPTPVRLIVLWATLVCGAALIAWMALSLLRNLRRPE
ncbi:MAG TPA: DUF3999 family protein [Solimonas sp.]|nr:DUF3999 family protein [Solimonas sp.]